MSPDEVGQACPRKLPSSWRPPGLQPRLAFPGSECTCSTVMDAIASCTRPHFHAPCSSIRVTAAPTQPAPGLSAQAPPSCLSSPTVPSTRFTLWCHFALFLQVDTEQLCSRPRSRSWARTATALFISSWARSQMEEAESTLTTPRQQTKKKKHANGE